MPLPSGGHVVASGLTTRTKKYAVKNEPKSMISDADEEEHAERRRADARALMGGRRPVMVVRLQVGRVRGHAGVGEAPTASGWR